MKKYELEKPQNVQGWVDIDETKNTNVYVSGLPSTITEEEFIVKKIYKLKKYFFFLRN